MADTWSSGLSYPIAKIPGTNIRITNPGPATGRRKPGEDGGRDEGTQKDRLAAANVGQAYVSRTGKSGGRKGEKKVMLSKDVRARAEELGVDLPNMSWRGNRSAVAADVKAFNEAMAAAEQAEADAAATEEAATTDTTDTTDAFDIDVGDGEIVEAADPADYGLAAAEDPVAVAPAEPAVEGPAANTLLSGTFDDDYMSGATVDTGQTSAASAVIDQAVALDESVGAAEDEAIADYTAGTRGTIMTSPQGLLTDEDDFFTAANLEEDPFLRPGRSLGGGLLY